MTAKILDGAKLAKSIRAKLEQETRDWVSKGNIDYYMSNHRYDKNITELKKYFNKVIDWISSIFEDVESEMCGLEWGRLYEEYRSKSYITKKVSERKNKLYSDPYVIEKKGIFEFNNSILFL